MQTWSRNCTEEDVLDFHRFLVDVLFMLALNLLAACICEGRRRLLE